MNERDEVSLRHILDAAREAQVFADGRTIDDLRRDRLFFLATVKEIEIIGEAANRISDETKREFPSVPWLMMIGMRNRLIHAYEDIDHTFVWSVVKVHLPDLVRELEKILPDFAEPIG